MKELEKIYELWSAAQSDTSDVIHKWCDLDAYLYDTCTDAARENIEDYMMEYGKVLEKQSFIAGFKQAFKMWEEIYCFHEK